MIAREVAEREIAGWLDYKKVNASKREAYRDSIDVLVGAVSDGDIVVNEDFTLTHRLKFDTGGDEPVTQLVYQPRVRVGAIQKQLQGVKPTDTDGRVAAYIAAISDQPKAVVKNLDTEDYAICSAVVVFFL